MKTLLIVSAGVEAVTGINLAQSMGLHVVVSDMNPSAPGFTAADDHIIASTYDVEATVAAARNYHQQVRPIDGVICIASDVPLTVASVAADLGLPGITVTSAQLATDKLAMKQHFAADGVPIPWFSHVNSAEHLRDLVKDQGLPLVIKPVDSRGSRGVLRLSADVDLEWAYSVAQHHSPTDRVMVERFLSGPQVSTESLVVNGIAHTPGFADRNYELLERYAPHIIENGGQLPSHLPAATQQAVRQLVQQAATSLGIHNGVVKGDIVVWDGKPHVIELAARLSGGYFCTHEIPLSTGVDLVGAAIRQALGELIDPADLQPRFLRPVAQRYWFPQPGIVQRIEGAEQFSDHPSVPYLELRVQPGDHVGPIDSHPARAGVVITTGETGVAAVALAEEIVKTITITTNPD
jgi:biotin carboxylase